MKPEQLEAALVWRDDGHLHDVAVTAIADAQDVVPPSARAHLETCEACALRVGQAALVSAAAGEALAGRQAARVARPVPVRAIAGALALAAVSATPLALELPRTFARSGALVLRALPVLVRGVVAALRSPEAARGASMASVVSALVFVAATLAFMRASKQSAIRQGVEQ